MPADQTLNNKKYLASWIIPRLGIQALCSALLLCAAGPVAAQRGAITTQQSLVEMVDQAGTIVRGHIIRTQVLPHPEFPALPTVVVTIGVKEVLKGEAGETFTFRQFIWDVRDRYDAAGYRKGGEVLLFLTASSDVGLSSPVGLGQGRFRIVRDAQGQEYILNEVGNSGLFRDLRAVLEKRGAVLSDEQMALLESFTDGPVSLSQVQRFVRQLMRTR